MKQDFHLSRSAVFAAWRRHTCTRPVVLYDPVAVTADFPRCLTELLQLRGFNRTFSGLNCRHNWSISGQTDTIFGSVRWHHSAAARLDSEAWTVIYSDDENNFLLKNIFLSEYSILLVQLCSVRYITLCVILTSHVDVYYWLKIILTILIME